MGTVAKMVTPKTGRGTGRSADWRKPVGRNRNVAEQRAVLTQIRKLVRDKGKTITEACCAVEISDNYYYALKEKFSKTKKTAPQNVKARMTVKTLSPKERLAQQDERIASLARAVDLMSRQVEKLVKDWS